MKSVPVSFAKVAVLAAVLIFAVGCFPKEQFPVEPSITMKSFEQFGDSASLTISFTDGNGDIGLEPSNLQPPFDTGSTYFHNMFLEYEELQNGVWVRPTLAIPFYYRIPNITPTGQNKVLEGDIAVALKPWPVFPAPPGSPNDTIRFSVQLVDRALNLSNTELTEQVIVVH
ncbi:MAG: hypothetical protein WEC15_07390 [Flavobacteriales bacterium]